MDSLALATGSCSVLENTGAQTLVLGALDDYNPGEDNLAADSLKTTESLAVATDMSWEIC